MWSDNESQTDYLNRSEIVRAACVLVRRTELLPLSIGIFGDWGSGKSTLLRLIKSDLEIPPAAGERRHVVVEFDAWLYDGFDDTRTALMEVIADALVSAAGADKNLIAKALDLFRRVDRLRVIGKLARAGLDYATGMPVGTAASALWNIGQHALGGDIGTEDVSQARDIAKETSEGAKDFLKERDTPPKQIAGFRQHYNEILDQLGITLVVIVDNLDRCLPSSTIRALEAIRLFLFMNSTAFIIAADQAMVQNAVKRHYGDDSASHAHFYLDKFIQVPLRLPYAGPSDVRVFLYLLLAEAAGVSASTKEDLATFVAGLHAEGNRPIRTKVIEKFPDLPAVLPAQFDLADRLAPMLASAPGVQGNPRIIKRLMNAARIRQLVASDRGLSVDEELIVKVTLFERCAPTAFPSLLEMIAPERVEKLIKLEEIAARDPKSLAQSLPDLWKGISPEFMTAWFGLSPSFRDANLGPILYLCREVLALSGTVTLLTGKAREAFEILAEIDRVSSPTGDEAVTGLVANDASAAMAELIAKLRRIADWGQRPKGVAGAIRLAQAFAAEATVLASFLSTIKPLPVWLVPLIDREPWAADLVTQNRSIKAKRAKS